MKNVIKKILLTATLVTTLVTNVCASTVNSYVKNGTTMVPVRTITENLGANVEFDSNTNKIKITKDSTNVVLTINSKSVQVNGANKALLESAFIKDGTTYVPLRFISETFGCNVELNNKTVNILDDGKTIISTTPIAYQTEAPKTTIVQEQAPQTNGKTVYWTDKGKVYHSSPNCQTLSRSKDIHSGTISESGKARGCKVCGA